MNECEEEKEECLVTNECKEKGEEMKEMSVG